MSALLDADRMRSLLQELSDELAARHQTAHLYVVGGAAMVLAYDSERATEDIDSVFQPVAPVRDATSAVASRHSLSPDWVNDGAKGFMPHISDDPVTVFETESLLVTVASAQYLLAMKLFSARPERDLDDAVLLWRVVGFKEVSQGMDLLEKCYPPYLLLPKHRHVIETVAEEAAP